MGAAGESATAIAALLKRKAAGVHQRAHLLKIKLARSPTRAEAEVEMTFQPGDTVRLSKLGESRMKRAPAEDWKDRGSRKQKP
jgi:hypothetical protein